MVRGGIHDRHSELACRVHDADARLGERSILWDEGTPIPVIVIALQHVKKHQRGSARIQTRRRRHKVPPFIVKSSSNRRKPAAVSIGGQAYTGPQIECSSMRW